VGFSTALGAELPDDLRAWLDDGTSAVLRQDQLRTP
jgi:hypothetical protein